MGGFGGGVIIVRGGLAVPAMQAATQSGDSREELIAQQMRLELGEITEEEFRPKEAELLAKIREIRERHIAEAEAAAEDARFLQSLGISCSE